MSKSQITSFSFSSKPTPMIEQFLKIKLQYQEFLLFYRMGDFYEMFFHDAELASKLLGIALTKRGQLDGVDIPMCGVPVHAMDGYLERLIRFGQRVAICEQSETPESYKKRGGKGPLPRAVVRVVTAGTINEDSLLAPNQNNFLAAIGYFNVEFAIAWVDMSTGTFQTQTVNKESILSAIECLNPVEILYPENQEIIKFKIKEIPNVFPLPAAAFDSNKLTELAKNFFSEKSSIDFSKLSRAQLSSVNGILNYLNQTQILKKPYLQSLVLVEKNRTLEIDPATRRSLEITKTLSGEKKSCLLSSIDKTKTAIGARLLANRIASPSAIKSEIDDRLDLASWFLCQSSITTEISSLLKGLPDFERSLARLSVSRGGPRDLLAFATAIIKTEQISKLIQQAVQLSSPAILVNIDKLVAKPHALSLNIIDALADDLPLLPREGHFIRHGFDIKLDSLRKLSEDSKRHIALLQQEYSKETGVASLKLKFNNVLGYHIEVRSIHADKLISEEKFIHRQTTAQAVRFTTTVLANLERELSAAADKALAIELLLFDRMVEEILECQIDIAHCAAAIAEIDVAVATVSLAEQNHYVRPKIADNTQFVIEAGRHPVVETKSDHNTPFIENDCNLSEGKKIWLVTGPNMAGKSTFLRQNAHIIILAQAGLFVPAKRAEIGIVDKLFSRVGASDDLARGQSTFMVEMLETAAILKQATPKSFVILDEIGRGTSTYDGLAIAQATLENLHNVNRCRGLFATHYHELTILEDSLSSVASYHMKIKEWNHQIIFLHQVSQGRAGRSYGIHVAMLAGLPQEVIERAKNILFDLEEKKRNDEQVLPEKSPNLPLFVQSQNSSYTQGCDTKYIELKDLLESFQPDDLSPKEALNILYEIHDLFNKGRI